ncbi:type 2 isopentenyl-diphosphate Delta-isomerase [bacterium]|nr:type 2 isopentenyl-diphosphate Delta-isomerase [bacterium]
MDTTLSQRKSEHLKLVAEGQVSHHGTNLLEEVHLLHQALPGLDLDEVRLDSTFFNRTIHAPLMITSMTGGAEYAGRLNHGLARVAEKLGIPFAVGSQRVMIRHPETTSDFAVREVIPNGVLLGNIGAVQLLEHPVEVIAGLAEAIDADGLCVHLNVAQELMQVDGNRSFRGLLEAMDRLMEKMDGRILVKETGAGLSPQVLQSLHTIGVPYIDVSGAGGTSWTRVESLREANAPLHQSGELFGDWGIPTAVCVAAAHSTFGDKATIIASGGIRNGLDAARSIALGADIAGFAREVLLRFLEGDEEGAIGYINGFIHDLKLAMLLSGAVDVSAMKQAPRVLSGELHRWLHTLGLLDGE